MGQVNFFGSGWVMLSLVSHLWGGFEFGNFP